MWLGVVHYSSDEDGVPDDGVILVAYESHRLFSLGVPTEAAPLFIRLLRDADCGGRPPRCGRCEAALEVPPLDDLEAECASA
jgi:hypothetical protein